MISEILPGSSQHWENCSAEEIGKISFPSQRFRGPRVEGEGNPCARNQLDLLSPPRLCPQQVRGVGATSPCPSTSLVSV